MNRFSQKIVAVALTALLVSIGVIMGIIVQRSWLGESKVPSEANSLSGTTPSPTRPSTDIVFKKFKQELDLTEQQGAKVKVLLEQVERDASEIQSGFRTNMEALMAEADNEIAKVLDETQRKRYYKLVEARKQRVRQRRPTNLHRTPEARPVGASRGPAQIIERLDSDGSKTLDREELSEGPGPFATRILERFDKLDTSGDGQLSEDELLEGRPGRASRRAPGE